ncbi:MAG: hypothetical protein AAF196_11530 [Planctomycetota bacterium]
MTTVDRLQPSAEVLDSTTTSLSGSRDPVIQFLAPGLLHGLNNQLMVLRGALHPKAAEKIPPEVLERASEGCENALLVMRGLLAPIDQRVGFGVVAETLGLAAEVAFRDAGLRLDFEFQARARRAKVELKASATRLSIVLHAVFQLFDGGPGGTVRIRSGPTEKAAGPSVRFEFVGEALALPFPIDWAGAAERAQRQSPLQLELRTDGESPESSGLLLRIPR